MYVCADHKLDDYYVDIIKDELNMKKVEFTDDASAYINYKFKPQLKTLGPKYGRHINEIRTALSELDGHKAMAELDSTSKMKITISIGEIELDKEDVLIESEQEEGFFTLTEGGTTVAISTKLTPELIEEGFVREIISKIQTMRKESGFEVMDHIVVNISGNDKIAEIAEKNRKVICHDVLAEEIKVGAAANSKEWDINGEKVTVAVTKI